MHHNVSTLGCQWIHNFLSNRKLFVKVGAHMSEPLYLSIGNLGTTIQRDLKWNMNIYTITKKGQQCMYFLVQFYSTVIESIITSSISVWFDSASSHSERRLERIVWCAEKIIWLTQDREGSTGNLDRHHSHKNCIKTARHLHSFFPQAMTFINKDLSHIPPSILICHLYPITHTDKMCLPSQFLDRPFTYLHFHCW